MPRNRSECSSACPRCRTVVDAAGQRFAAREAEEGSERFGLRFDHAASSVGGLAVVAGVVKRLERSPDLEAKNFVGLARHAAHDDDRRSVFLRERRPLHATGGLPLSRADRECLDSRRLAFQLQFAPLGVRDGARQRRRR